MDALLQWQRFQNSNKSGNLNIMSSVVELNYAHFSKSADILGIVCEILFGLLKDGCLA